MGDTDDDTATDSATDAINTSDDEGNFFSRINCKKFERKKN